MNKRKPALTAATETDPFQNMILRPNRSPVLKPVVVSSHTHLQISRSAGSLREKFKLPPVSSTRKSEKLHFAPVFDRTNLNTPNFKISSKPSVHRSLPKKPKEKPPLPDLSYRHNYERETQKEFNNFYVDVSFGEIDEQVAGINEKMKRYKY